VSRPARSLDKRLVAALVGVLGLVLVATAGLALLLLRSHPAIERYQPPPFDIAPIVDEPVPSAIGSGHSGGAALVAPGWVATMAARTGIPQPAVRAYGDAVLLSRGANPGCAIGWTTLAGLGHIESAHGTIGGRTLLADGHPDRPILGPTLDGTGDVAAIPATRESARWHGDARWDHAVGPLQFLPSTWRRWGSDGDGDGVADPNDLDDAAYAAARYLCADGHDMTTGAGWGRAIFAYNHAAVYVDSVYAAAVGYARASVAR
jgi:hypothetical protein